MITPEVVTALERNLLALESRLTQQPDAPAPFVAEALREVWPAAVLCACSLGDDCRRQVAVAGSVPAGLPERLSANSAWDSYLSEMGTVVLASEECVQLAVVLGDSVRPEEAALARLGLRSIARLLSLQLLRRGMCAAKEELDTLDPLANAGELSGVVAHELTNFLNILLLQVSLLETTLPESAREDLSTIRRRGSQASELLNRFQEYRRASSNGSPPVDLDAAVRSVADRLVKEMAESFPITVADSGARRVPPPPGGVTIVLKSSGPDTPIRGMATDVRRLVRFLVGNSVRAAAQAGGQVVVALEPADGGTRLRVEDSVPFRPPSEVSTLFDASSQPREGVDGLELAACRSLARRLRCGLAAEARSEGGLRLTADFRGAT